MKIKTLYRIINRPVVAAVLIRDVLKIPNHTKSDEEHLAATMQWLCRAQDVTGGKGVSSGWSVKNGWLPPYPETTGYLIPSFLKYAAFSGDLTFVDRAIKMGIWELEIQFPSGAFPSSFLTGNHPLVFDTGQIIQGLIALFVKTGDRKWLDAAIRAGQWIISLQQKDGTWINGSHKNIPHAYYTRVAWPLLELWNLSGIDEFRLGAESFLQWVLSLRRPNGWIDKMGFNTDDDPLTHTVAYTYEGLLECMPYLNPTLRLEVLETIENALGWNLSRQQTEMERYSLGLFPAFINRDWQYHGTFSCLVGNAQLALVYLRMYEITANTCYQDFSLSILEKLKSVQVLFTTNQNLYGALPGARPFWGGYGSLSFINWAGKFFADLLMLKLSTTRGNR